ncbi:hypothetical protein Dsin_001673 [Dipteronia sinensis]|uniref:Uncharacterized protein n=1 Tax=Dipteronia sinensis TaxID=43782 RepID=A0AAE0EJ75_9ROSI|nr:hypothetical protein Dsin_001673 [Dipteronia sinensis]
MALPSVLEGGFDEAFDTVEWDFLLETFAAFCVPSKVISWIKVCITTPKFSISIIGELVGFFHSKMWLRQGRLQLIISVLSSIQVFWASHICLPSKVLRSIEQTLCSFCGKVLMEIVKGQKLLGRIFVFLKMRVVSASKISFIGIKL